MTKTHALDDSFENLHGHLGRDLAPRLTIDSGDLVVYRQGSTISHTAVVRYVTEGQPVLVEGKWGTLGVYLHPADKSFYGTEFTFHRSGRSGHLLVGMGGSPGPSEVLNQTAE